MSLTDLQLDALKETTSIGAGNAATALSKLAKRTITMTVPRANLSPLSVVRTSVPKDKNGSVLVRLSILGPLPGTILIGFDHASALILADLLLERKAGQTTQLGEFEVSALQEAANILSGSYLTALSTFLDVSMRNSVPFLAIDEDGHVVTGIFEELGSADEQTLVIHSTLHERDRSLQVTMFLKPQPEALAQILKALKVDRQ